MDTTEKLLEMMETNKEITKKIKELVDKQRDLIDNLLFLQLIAVESTEEEEDDSA